MIIGSVPLYNVMAVLVLSLCKPEQKGVDRGVFQRTIKGIVTNPIILGIAAGLLWSALGIPMPRMLDKMVSGVAGMTTPMGLIAMGAAFDIRKAFVRFFSLLPWGWDFAGRSWWPFWLCLGRQLR